MILGWGKVAVGYYFCRLFGWAKQQIRSKSLLLPVHFHGSIEQHCESCERGCRSWWSLGVVEVAGRNTSCRDDVSVNNFGPTEEASTKASALDND